MEKYDITEEELEMMNYNDIAHLILEKNNKKMKINELFREVCEILNLDDKTYEDHIADFFELLSTDKRFTMLENGFWDLKIKHNKGMIMESDDEDEDEDIVIDDEPEDDTDNEEDYDEDKTDDDIEEDDLADLVIIDDSEDENN